MEIEYTRNQSKSGCIGCNTLEHKLSDAQAEIDRLKGVLQRIEVIAGEAMSNSGHELASLQDIFFIVHGPIQLPENPWPKGSDQ